jgi:cell division septation protein DedD
VTFFDNLRLKSLGGRLDSPFALRSPAPRPGSRDGMGALEGKPPRPARGTDDRSRKGQVEFRDAAPRVSSPRQKPGAAQIPALDTDRPSRLAPQDPRAVGRAGAADNASAPDSSVEEAAREAAEKSVRKAAKEGIGEARKAGGSEPRLILGVKWLVKLMLSAVFLVWIFFLGVIVGRGTILNSAAAPDPDDAALQANLREGVQGDAARIGSFSGYADPESFAEPSPYGGEAVFPEDAAGGGPYAYMTPYGSDPGFEGPGAPGAAATAPYPGPAPGIPTVYGAGPPVGYPAPGGTQPGSGEAPLVGVASARPAAVAAAGAPIPVPTASAPAAAPDPVAELQARRDRDSQMTDGLAPAPAKPTDATVYWPGPPSGKGLYTVQVAAPTSEEEARATAESYRKRGFDAYYYATGKGRFPTRVGRYGTEKEAGTARDKLEAAGAKGPYVSKLNL